MNYTYDIMNFPMTEKLDFYCVITNQSNDLKRSESLWREHIRLLWPIIRIFEQWRIYSYLLFKLISMWLVLQTWFSTLISLLQPDLFLSSNSWIDSLKSFLLVIWSSGDVELQHISALNSDIPRSSENPELQRNSAPKRNSSQSLWW